MDKINPSYLAHTFKYWIRDTHQSRYAYKSAFTFDEHYDLMFTSIVLCDII